MTIFKYIIIRLTIFCRQKTGSVENIEISQLKTNKKKIFVQFLRDSLGDLQKKLSF